MESTDASIIKSVLSATLLQCGSFGVCPVLWRKGIFIYSLLWGGLPLSAVYCLGGVSLPSVYCVGVYLYLPCIVGWVGVPLPSVYCVGGVPLPSVYCVGGEALPSVYCVGV